MKYYEYVVKDKNNVLLNSINLSYGKRIISKQDLSKNLIEVKYDDIKSFIENHNNQISTLYSVNDSNYDSYIKELNEINISTYINIINNCSYSTNFQIIKHE